MLPLRRISSRPNTRVWAGRGDSGETVLSSVAGGCVRTAQMSAAGAGFLGSPVAPVAYRTESVTGQDWSESARLPAGGELPSQRGSGYGQSRRTRPCASATPRHGAFPTPSISSTADAAGTSATTSQRSARTVAKPGTVGRPGEENSGIEVAPTQAGANRPSQGGSALNRNGRNRWSRSTTSNVKLARAGGDCQNASPARPTLAACSPGKSWNANTPLGL